jgi:hypothetical protein
MKQPETKLEYVIENERLREVNTELLEALERVQQRTLDAQTYGLSVKEAVMIHDIARAAIKAAKGDA